MVVSQFNGTSTPKGSYSAKTGDNDCNGVTVTELTIRILVVFLIEMGMYYRLEYSLLKLLYIVFSC